MNNIQQNILEAFKGYLDQKARLGLSSHKDKQMDKSNRTQIKWEGLNDAFALKVAGSPFFESLTAVFYRTHSWRYICDDEFKATMELDLKSMGIPCEEIEKALKAVDSLIENLTKENPGESASGWHPDLDEIADMTRNADNRKHSKSGIVKE